MSLKDNLEYRYNSIYMHKKIRFKDADPQCVEVYKIIRNNCSIVSKNYGSCVKDSEFALYVCEKYRHEKEFHDSFLNEEN